MANVKIFGIEAAMTIKSWADKFVEEYADDESATYVSKDVFKSDGDPDLKDFTYHYVIDCNYLYDNKSWNYALRLVVDVPSISGKVLSSICEMSGIETKEITFNDIIAHGGCDVKFGDKTRFGEVLNENVLTKIANVFECMDALKGFYLDKTWNALGSNGFDTLRHALEGEDLLTPALKRRFNIC